LDSDVPKSSNLLQEYTELRARFTTTNARVGRARSETPLSILNGFVSCCKVRSGPLSDRQRDVLREMQTSGTRLQQFIQDFLTYSVPGKPAVRKSFETEM